MKSTISDRIFYHIYPLGMCGAPLKNDFTSPAGDGLRKLCDRIPHIVSLGVNAVYIGPLFESTAHGYDTLDYWYVDRRLGTNEDLTAFVSKCHENGIAVVLDAVLNHTGRHFFALTLRGRRNWRRYCSLLSPCSTRADRLARHGGLFHRGGPSPHHRLCHRLRNDGRSRHVGAAHGHCAFGRRLCAPRQQGRCLSSIG